VAVAARDKQCQLARQVITEFTYIDIGWRGKRSLSIFEGRKRFLTSEEVRIESRCAFCAHLA
jgi:hypothetical protein